MMTYPAYLKERARQLRIKNQLTLDELADRLALPKTTVWHWIKDLPLARPRRENPHPGTLAMQAKYRRLRNDAYLLGQSEYGSLSMQPVSAILSRCTSPRATSAAETASRSAIRTRLS